MKPETIQRLIEEYEGEDLASYLAEQIVEKQATVERLANWKACRARMMEEQSEHRSNSDRWLRAIRADCKHHETIYHRDASGGNDSYYECRTCGQQTSNAFFQERSK